VQVRLVIAAHDCSNRLNNACKPYSAARARSSDLSSKSNGRVCVQSSQSIYGVLFAVNR